MAAGSSPPSLALGLADALKTSQDKTNFVRLTRLLISGGTIATRQLFDFIIAPANLTNVLTNSKTTLQRMKTKKILTQAQWDILFPPSGAAAESTSFDITLLFKLLREICGITPPATGWDNLPNSTDTSLGADLARIKYYRNTIYAHVKEEMELSNKDFQAYWKEIKGALLGIVKHCSRTCPSAVTECEKEINSYLTAPLSNDDKRNVEELRRLYFEDIELKDIISSVKANVEGIQAVLGERDGRDHGYPGVYPDIFVKCVVKLASVGAWLIGSAFIFNRYMDDPETLRTLVQDVICPVGVVVVAILKGSIEILLLATKRNALDQFWERYQTGWLRKELERVLVTQELKNLANNDDVEFEVSIREEEYERACEYLTNKDKKVVYSQMSSQLSESDEEEDFILISSPPKEVEVKIINGLVTADLTNYDVVSQFPNFMAINNLQVIRMPTNSLVEIPDEKCKIPNSFCRMKCLKKLCLFGDNIRSELGLSNLPTDFGKLQSLEELNLQHNNFSVFPEQVCELFNLRKLYLNSCGLTSISTNIRKLINLVEADLSQNDFSAGLPKELFDLPMLRDLYLIECKLNRLAPEIENLKHLEGLRLNDNYLQELPDELYNLRYLKKLSANNNRISKVSSKIINLQNLKVLLLKENDLKDLPEEISKLLNLQVMNVFDNKLTCLPNSISEMDSSLQIVIYGNEYLQKPPLSICSKGMDSIKGYFESMSKSRPVHSNRIKIVMLGEAGAGKTCLTKALVHCKATDHLDDESTIGVEMHHWQMEPDGLEACIVDLAGQRQYQQTHLFFLSEETLHILVVNLKSYKCNNKESFKENVEDWIEWVTARLLKPRIMIVTTHIDECDDEEVSEKCKDILKGVQEHEKKELKRLDTEIKKLKKKSCKLDDRGENAELEQLKWMKKCRPVVSSKILLKDNQGQSKNLQEDYSAYTTIVPVSSKEELHGMISLRNEIKRVAKTNDLFPSVGRDLPKSWLKLEEAIKEYREVVAPPQVPCMTMKEFKKFAKEKAELVESEVTSALEYFDSVGEIKFYSRITETEYSVFLDLQWLCKIVKLLFRHDFEVSLEYQEEYAIYEMEKIKFENQIEELRGNGILSEALLRCIWIELELDDNEFQNMIKALMCFGLACKLTSDQSDDEGKFLIPWFLHFELDPEKKKYIFPNVPEKNVTEYRLLYAISGYLPDGLFDRLCVHSYSLSVDVSLWKNSMLICMGGDQVFLEIKDTCITVTGRTSESRERLWIPLLKIVEELEALLKAWPRLVYNTYTVCPHCVRNKTSKPHHFECKWLEGQGPRSLYCRKQNLPLRKPIDKDLLFPSKELLTRISKPLHPLSENVSDTVITKLSKSLAREWKVVATHLGLSHDEVGLIDANERKVEEKTNTMLHKWKESKGKDATRSKLIKALEENSRSDLADVVKRHVDD